MVGLVAAAVRVRRPLVRHTVRRRPTPPTYAGLNLSGRPYGQF